MEQFPKTLEAFRQHKDAEGKVEGALWLIGEALIEECGPPGPDGVNNGSGSKIEAARKFLKQEGIDYSLQSLLQLRSVADAFKPDKRLIGVSWTLHRDAGCPEVLEEAQTEGVKLTALPFKKWKAQRADQAERSQEDEADRAVRDCRKNIAEACESFSKAQTHVPAFPPLTDQNRDDLIAVAQSAIQKGTELKEMIARLGLPELREEREAA